MAYTVVRLTAAAIVTAGIALGTAGAALAAPADQGVGGGQGDGGSTQGAVDLHMLGADQLLGEPGNDAGKTAGGVG